MTDIIWNYDDIDQNILSVYRGKICIGYFRTDLDEFRIITEGQLPHIHIYTLVQIANGYSQAIKEAEKIVKTK